MTAHALPRGGVDVATLRVMLEEASTAAQDACRREAMLAVEVIRQAVLEEHPDAVAVHLSPSLWGEWMMLQEVILADGATVADRLTLEAQDAMVDVVNDAGEHIPGRLAAQIGLVRTRGRVDSFDERWTLDLVGGRH